MISLETAHQLANYLTPNFGSKGVSDWYNLVNLCPDAPDYNICYRWANNKEVISFLGNAKASVSITTEALLTQRVYKVTLTDGINKVVYYY